MRGCLRRTLCSRAPPRPQFSRSRRIGQKLRTLPIPVIGATSLSSGCSLARATFSCTIEKGISHDHTDP